MAMLPSGTWPPHWPIFPYWFHSPTDLFDSFFNARLRDNNAKLFIDKNGGLKYIVDTSGFKANELKIEVEDNYLTVKAEHKYEDEYEKTYRSLTRSIRIPDSVDKDTLASEVDEKGILIITAKGNGESGQIKKTLPIEHKKSEVQKDFNFVQNDNLPNAK